MILVLRLSHILLLFQLIEKSHYIYLIFNYKWTLTRELTLGLCGGSFLHLCGGFYNTFTLRWINKNTQTYCPRDSNRRRCNYEKRCKKRILKRDLFKFKYIKRIHLCSNLLIMHSDDFNPFAVKNILKSWVFVTN